MRTNNRKEKTLVEQANNSQRFHNTMFVHSSNVQRPPTRRRHQQPQKQQRHPRSLHRTYNGNGISTIHRITKSFHIFVSILVFVTTTLVLAAEYDVNAANPSSHQSSLQYKALVIDNRNFAIKMINASAFSSAVQRRSISDDVHRTVQTTDEPSVLCDCSSRMAIMKRFDQCKRVCPDNRDISSIPMPLNTAQRNIVATGPCCDNDKMLENDTFNTNKFSDLLYNTDTNHTTTTAKANIKNGASKKLRVNKSNERKNSNSITWQSDTSKSDYADNGHKVMRQHWKTDTQHQMQHDHHSDTKNNSINRRQLSATLLVENVESLQREDSDSIRLNGHAYDSIDTVSDANRPMAASIQSNFETLYFLRKHCIK